MLAHGDGFSLFGKQDELKLTVIADVGEAEKIEAPIGKPNTRDMIKMSGRCFESIAPIGFWPQNRKAALVVIDQLKNIKIATLEKDVSSIKVELLNVIQVNCNSNYPELSPGTLEKQIEAMKKRQEAFDREVELLKNRK